MGNRRKRGKKQPLPGKKAYTGYYDETPFNAVKRMNGNWHGEFKSAPLKVAGKKGCRSP